MCLLVINVIDVINKVYMKCMNVWGGWGLDVGVENGWIYVQMAWAVNF